MKTRSLAWGGQEMRAAKFILFKQASDEFNWSSRSKSEMMKNWNWKSVGGTCTCTISNGNEIKEYEFPSSLFDFVTDSHFSDGQRIIYFIGGLLLRANCDMGINKYRVIGEEKKKKGRKKIRQKIVRQKSRDEK